MPHSDPSILICPICNRRASANQNIYIPFCSTRCQTIDLGNWLSDNYRIPVTSTDEDELDTQDNESPETSE